MTPNESEVEAIQGILVGGNASGSYHKGDQTQGKTVRFVEDENIVSVMGEGVRDGGTSC